MEAKWILIIFVQTIGMRIVYERGGSMLSTFVGFPKEIIDFLFSLQFCNTVDNQSVNMEKYKPLVSEPLMLLYETLLPVAAKINLRLTTKPHRCISTPYTDRRFSIGKPLKEYMYIRFKESGKDYDIAGLYFDMGFEHYGYGLRIYKQTSSGMQSLREQILDKPKPFVKELAKVIDSGFTIVGDSFKKDHYPEVKDKLLNDFLNRKGFYIEKSVAINDNVFSAKLADEITNGFYAVSGILKILEGRIYANTYL